MDMRTSDRVGCAAGRCGCKRNSFVSTRHSSPHTLKFAPQGLLLGGALLHACGARFPAHCLPLPTSPTCSARRLRWSRSTFAIMGTRSTHPVTRGLGGPSRALPSATNRTSLQADTCSLDARTLTRGEWSQYNAPSANFSFSQPFAPSALADQHDRVDAAHSPGAAASLLDGVARGARRRDMDQRRTHKILAFALGRP